jgi:hypothetical protein
MALQQAFRRLTGPFREFGAAAGALYVLDRLLRRISGKLRLLVYELMVQPIPDAPLIPPNAAGQLELREIAPGDPELALMPVRDSVKQARFGQGAMCLGAFRRETLVGYIWLTSDRYSEDEVRCDYLLSPVGHSVFDFDLYIFPQYRMGRAFVGIWNGVNEHLRNRGINYSFSRITRFNEASRRAHARLGSRRVAVALFLKAWNVEVMCASRRPYFCIALGPRDRARLLLRATAN